MFLAGASSDVVVKELKALRKQDFGFKTPRVLYHKRLDGHNYLIYTLSSGERVTDV